MGARLGSRASWLGRVVWSCGVLAALGVSGCLTNQPPLAPMAEVVDYPREHFTLTNGLSVVVETTPDTGIAGVALVVGSGAAAEDKEKEGLAHLTEHLAFEARMDANGATRWSRLKNQGGVRVNGATTLDTTSYWAYVPASNLAPVLDLFAELVQKPLVGVTAEDFAHELAIVQNERRLRTENGTPGQAFGWLSRELYDARHPYARSVAGSRRSLAALSLEDALAFAERAYTERNCTLAVSAPRTVDARALVQRVFNAQVAPPATLLARKAILTREPPPPSPAGLPIGRYEALVSNPTLWVGWSVPSGYGQQGAVAPLLVPMIRGVFAGNLYRRDASIGAVNVGYQSGVRGDVVYVMASLTDANVAQAAFDSVVREAQIGVVERNYGDILTRYKQWAAVQSTYDEETLEGRTNSLAMSAHVTGDPSFISRRDRAIIGLTPEAVETYFRKYLTAERARGMLIMPGVEPVDPSQGAGPKPSVATADAGVGLDARTFAGWMSPFGMQRAHVSQLSNGLRLVALPVPGAVFHTVLLGFPGGSAAAEVPGVDVAARWAVFKEAWEQSSQGLYHTQPVELDATKEVLRSTGQNLGVTLHALRQELDAEYIWWPPQEFVRRLDTYRRSDESPPSQLWRSQYRALFGDHVYGYLPTADAINEVTATQISHWRELTRRPNNALLVVVGNFDPSAVQAAAEAELGSWLHGAPAEPVVPAPTPVAASAPRLLFKDWPGNTQPSIGLACALPVQANESPALFNLLARAMEERLQTWLRERLGGTYGVSASMQCLRGGSALLSFHADAAYELFDEAVAEFKQFTHSAPPVTFSERELQTAQRGFASEYNFLRDGTAATADIIFDQWKLGLPLEELDNDPKRVLSVTLSDMNALAQRCQSHAVLSLLGDRARIAPRLVAGAEAGVASN